MTTKPGTDRATTPPTTPPEPKKTPTEVTSEEELTPEELDQASGGERLPPSQWNPVGDGRE
jgi:hypothetical protein